MIPASVLDRLSAVLTAADFVEEVGREDQDIEDKLYANAVASYLRDFANTHIKAIVEVEAEEGE